MNGSSGSLKARLVRWFFPAVALAVVLTLAGPAAAFVVVTSDNEVYQVPTRPEVRGGMVFFNVDGVPVSLRVFDVNVQKTNEFNHALDQGHSGSTIARMAASLPRAQVTDDRLIVSHRLQQRGVTDQPPGMPDFRLVREDELGRSKSFSDRPGASLPPNTVTPWPRSDSPSFADTPGRPAMEVSPFAMEARRAYEDAGEEVADSGGSDVADQIAAEQEHLRRLTAGEVVVDDLDREIDRSMEKIRRLQSRSSRRSSGRSSSMSSDSMMSDPMMDEAPAARSSSRSSGRRAAPGSKEAKWLAELDELEERLRHYQSQRTGLGSGTSRDREVLDDRVGELEYRIERLHRRLDRASGR